MTAISISKIAQAQLQVAQWIRNGKAPVAEIQNRIATLVGFAASVRTKQVFSSYGMLFGAGEAKMVPSSLATRKRWRRAFHSAPFANFLVARFELCPQDNGTATDPYAICELKDTKDVVLGIARMHWGSSDGSYADDPINNGGGVTTFVNPTDSSIAIILTPDTEYTLTFSDVGFGRLQSAEVHEVAFAPNTAFGYAQNTLGAGAPVLAGDRSDVVEMARHLHKRCGTPVISWHSDLDSTAPSSAGVGGEGALAASIGPITLSATGTTGVNALNESIGNITLSATGSTATFEVAPSTSDDTPAHGATVTMSATARTNDTAQTNATFGCRIGPWVDNDEVVVESVASSDVDGWTVDADWARIDNYWVAQFSLAVVPANLLSTLAFDVTFGSSVSSIGRVGTFTTDSNTISGVDGTNLDTQTDQAQSPESTPVFVTVD